MKKLSSVFNMLLLSVLAYAVPASPAPFEYIQPDGTTLLLHNVGDEFCHWVESEDNQIVMKNVNGYYEYATIIDNEIVCSGIRISSLESFINTIIPPKNNILNILYNKRLIEIARLDSLSKERKITRSDSRGANTSSLTSGNQKVLCILIDFSDRVMTKTNTDFSNMWNATGYNVEGSQGSIKEFYLENSYNAMNVQATVVGPYRAQHVSSYYDSGTGVSNSHVRSLVREALNAAKEDVDFSDFDVNNDNIVDAVHIVYAGYAKESNNDVGLIWSHKGNLIIPVYQGSYMATNYIITSELSDGSGSAIAPMGTVCHEYGHILGAPDFYSHTDQIGTKYWDLMAEGCWNGYNYNGRCPAHHNPYTKSYIFNWCTPTTINTSIKNVLYELPPSHNSPAYYRINTSTSDEFFLLENKAKIYNTFNYQLPNSGLIVYHIHSGIANTITNNTVNDSHPQKCYIVSANATTEPNNNPSSYDPYYNLWAYPINDKIFFSNQSIPSATSWAGVSTGVGICLIQRSGNNIKFVVNPEINGPNSIVLDDEIYSVANVPSNAKIKWTYSFTPDTPEQLSMLGDPIIFVNGDSTTTVTLRRGRYYVLDYMSNGDGESYNDIKGWPLLYHYFNGTAIITATITSSGVSHSISKTITLGSTSLNSMININSIEDEDTITIDKMPIDFLKEKSQLNTDEFRLLYFTHAIEKNVDIIIEKKENDVYSPYMGEYQLTIWSYKYGLVRQCQGLNNDTMEFDNLPSDIYFLVLSVNNNIVAVNKMIIL